MSIKCQQTVNKTQKRLQNPKKSAVFFCEICDYNTCHKSHYTKHLASKKHVNKMSIKSQKTAPKKCRKVPPVFGGVLPHVSSMLSLKWYMPIFETVSLKGHFSVFEKNVFF